MDSSVARWVTRKRHRMQKQSYDEVQVQRCNLPIYAMKVELQQILALCDVVVFKGDTACGKTTQIPQFILSGGFAETLAIAVTQPYRATTISIAERVAQEMGTEIGERVGYCVQYENATSEKTKIKFITDSMLLRECISDPLLSSYSWIILDEAHERTMHMDVLFGFVKAAKEMRTLGPMPLKIVVMSATIDEKKFSKYFNNAPIYHLPSRKYKITINYSNLPDNYVIYAISVVFHIHNCEPDGDILVFMTGVEEIESAVAYTHRVLLEASDSSRELLPYALYATLSSQLQYTVFQPTPPMARKVIYSTCIAETSLTIPGIKYVIDTGMARSRFLDPAFGLDFLKIHWISKAQAEQRTGRAGRMYEGFCYRLYTTEQYQALEEFPVPEIQRCTLLNTFLQALAIGISDIHSFDFLDRPSDENINTAIGQLILLGAAESDPNGKIYLTECGQLMVHFPLDPRFSKMIVKSEEFKCTCEILTIIALLSVGSIFVIHPSTQEKYLKYRNQYSNGEGDHIMLLNLCKAFQEAPSSCGWCVMHAVNYKRMTKAVAVREQLSQICQRIGIMPYSSSQDTAVIRKCLCSGFFMNSVYLYKNEIYRAIGSKQKISMHCSSSLYKKKPSCCIYTGLVETSKCYMINISVIDEEWLHDAAPEYFEKCGF